MKEIAFSLPFLFVTDVSVFKDGQSLTFPKIFFSKHLALDVSFWALCPPTLPSLTDTKPTLLNADSAKCQRQ